MKILSFKSIVLFSILLLWTLSVMGIERRRPQISTEFGYIVSPLFYRLEGVGEGGGLLAAINNIYDTPIDVFGNVLEGDVAGNIGLVSDIPLIKDYVFADYLYLSFNKGSTRVYEERGMTGNEKYNISELKKVHLTGYRLTFMFWKRRLEFLWIGYETDFQAGDFKDKDGNVLAESDGSSNKFKINQGTVKLDYTDDRQDPRKGLRLVYTRDQNEDFNQESPKFSVNNYILTGYIPMLANSTWAFNYSHSDTEIHEKGLTDKDSIRSRYSNQCTGLNGEELDECDRKVDTLVNNQINQNKYGNATSLGGNSRLRSFAEGRFTAAYSRFWGTEFRWNLTEDEKPYDIFIAKDFRTALQWAFFYETGTVADFQDKLYEETRFSAGTGIRIVTKSGFVYRLDVANGNEGTGVVFFFDYPWGSIN